MSYQLEIRHLKYFLAVADELHYRKASEKLFISQPGLSRQIKQLEEILEAQLFIRSKRKVALTEAGTYLKGEVEFILNHLEMVKKQLKMIDKGEDGEIRIGFLGSAMQNVIPDLLVKMHAKFPDVKTSLREMPNMAQIEAIAKDELDIGFIRMPSVPEGMHMHTVFEDTFSVVLPKNSSIQERNFKNVRQLANEHFILFARDYSPLYYNTIMSICEDQGFKPQIYHKSVHAQTIFKLVESGLGVSIVPTSLQYGFDMDIQFIELKEIPQRANLSIVWKKDNRNPVLKNILELNKF